MKSTVATTALAVSLACTGIAAAQDKNVKIGVMTDMAGLYSDISGINSVLAVTMAVEDSGLREKGWKIDIISGDHQNKPDVATSLARQWADVENVDLYADVVTSSTALAVMPVAVDKNSVHLNSGAASSALSGNSCKPNTSHLTYNT